MTKDVGMAEAAAFALAFIDKAFRPVGSLCPGEREEGEGSIALAEEDEAESQLCKLDMYMYVSKAKGGTCHG